MVADLSPFLRSGGKSTVFWKPLEKSSLYARLITLSVILTMLFSYYRFDRPVSAYIDKILILFLLYSAIEILHIYAAMQSDTHEIYFKLHSAGQYVTIAIFVMMVYAFDLKRRFVCSPTGKFYEQTIQESPRSITRLRDELDNYILKAFFIHKNSSEYSERILRLTHKIYGDKQ